MRIAKRNDTKEKPQAVAKNASPAKQGEGSFLRILSYSTWLDRFLMGIAAISSVAAGAALPIMNIVFGELAGSFTAYFTPGSAVTEADFRASVNLNALYIFCLFLGKFFLGYVSIYAFRMSGIRISAAIRLAYLSALFDLPVSVVDKLPAGEATDTLTNAANTIQMAISDKLGLMLQSFSLVISAYIIAFVYSWKLTLVSSVVIVFVLALLKFTMPHLIKGYVYIITKNAMSSGVAGEVLRGIRTIKSLGAEEKASLWHNKHVNEAQDSAPKLARLVSLQFWPAFFATYANMALTFWAGIMFYTHGLLSGINALVIVLFSVLIVLSGVGTIFTPLQSITKASSASVACFRIIDLPKLNDGGKQAPDVKATEDIKFHDARFAYPSRPEAEVLKGINLTIRSGQVTALVGPSGCGKSTIVALLERWYDLSDVNEKLPQSIATPGTENGTTTDGIVQNSGKILLGEHNLESINRKWWRSQIGLVQQEPVLFNETIFENVVKGLMGSPFETVSKTEKLAMVKEACQEAFVDDFIRDLPSGYDTTIGESGIRLSGGQRQRLAIARSIIKRPPILIFDEATSSIDARSEQLVTAALDRASKGRTTIIIAHRLSTIRRADHIVVMSDGTVVEQGSHQNLMAKSDGVYSNLVQASNLEIGDSKEEEASEHQEDRKSKKINLQVDVAQYTDPDNQASKAKPKMQFRSVGQLLSEQKRYYPLYFFTLAGAVGAGATVPIQAWLFSHVVTIFNETDTAKLSSSGNFWSLMLFILAISAAISYATIGYCSTTISFNLSAEYRKSTFHDVLTKPIRWFDEEDHAVGSVTEQLGRDPQQLQELLGVNIAFPLIAVFNVLGCAIVSFVFGWKLSLVIFFASMPVIVIAAFFRVRYEMLFVAMNEKVFAKSSKFAAEAITSFRTVTALTLENTISKEYDTLLRNHIREAFMTGRFTVLIFALSDSLQLCSMALGFWYGGQLLARREYEPLQFFLIYAALIQGAQAAGQFLAYGPNVANATAAANRILSYRYGSELLSRDIDDEKREGHGCKIEFRNVGFRYPTRQTPVYNNLSFAVKPGQYVAFVGPSGCGKTTIISLLERFYDVDTGAILINDKDITNLSLPHYRSLCSVVAQEPTLFAGTVRENITLGIAPGTSTSQNDIDAACKAAEIYEFIVSLPQGFDTPISAGTHSSFSGGQKQRLCIARALLRNPQLLLLDEATNSLDSVSEGLVQKAIEQLGDSRSMTIVAVAHRLATVKGADRIFVMGEGGVILEDGTHGELIGKRGVYWDMCKAQALDS